MPTFCVTNEFSDGRWEFLYNKKRKFSKYQQNGQHKNQVLGHFPSEFLGQIQEIQAEYTDNQGEIFRFS